MKMTKRFLLRVLIFVIGIITSYSMKDYFLMIVTIIILIFAIFHHNRYPQYLEDMRR